MRQRHTARVQRPRGQTPQDERGTQEKMTPRPRRLPHAGGKKKNSTSKPGGTNAGPTLVWTCRMVPPGIFTAAVAATEAAAEEERTLNIHNVQSIICLVELWLPTTVPQTVG